MKKKALSFTCTLLAAMFVLLQVGPVLTVFADETKYQFKIFLNNGEPNIEEEHAEGESVSLPETPSREGFEFAYWEIEIQGTEFYRTDYCDFTLETMPNHHTFIRARWIATTAEESDITLGDLIRFGSYPQSEITDEETISALNSLVSDDDWVSYGYYSGTGSVGTMEPSDYMRYTDKELDGVKYRGIIFDYGRPEKVFASAGSFSLAVSNGGFAASTVYWFSYEPIIWRVLDPENKIITTDSIIDSQPFNNCIYKNEEISDTKFAYYSDPDYTNYANAYSTSSIRAWLNYDFYYMAFSSLQRDNIELTPLPENTDYFTMQGRSGYEGLTDIATDDYVWLLSNSEVNKTYVNAFGQPLSTNNKYNYYQNKSTPGTRYAQSQGAVKWNNYFRWFLRTPGHNSSYACYVDSGGTATINGTQTTFYTSYGIRPAMKLSDLSYIEPAGPVEHTVTYLSDGVEIGQETYFPNEEINTQIESPQKEGYTFIGWDGLPDAMPDKNITVNAIWQVNQYTITFYSEGGTEIDPITQNYGTEIVAPANPEKEGYTFTGWDNTMPETMPADNITLTAQWSINQYTVTFNTDGGNEIEAITQDYGAEITAPADPIKEGYTFTGWDKEIPKTVPAENVTLTALWTVNRYTVTFNTDGGSEIEAITQNYGTEITAPADPVKEGYTFTGWDRAIPETMPADSITLTAQWSVNQYTVSFNTDGAGYLPPLTFDYGAEITVNENPNKEGYTFIGWDNLPDKMPAENITVTALYSVNTYDLLLYDTDGSVIERISYAYGASVAQPQSPVRVNHQFLGWIGELPATMPSRNVYLTASWRMRLRSGTDDVTVICPDRTPFVNSDSSLSSGELQLVTEKLASANDKIPSAFNAREIGGDCYALYKITVKDQNGETVQPYGTYVTVRLPIPDGMDTNKAIFIMHFKPDGTTERITMADERVWFEGGYLCFTTNSFSEFGFYSDGDPSVSIKAIGKYNGKTLDYRSTLTLYAEAPYNTDSSIVWFVNGEKAGSGSSLTLKEMRNSEYKIQARIIENGEVVTASQTETVKINNGFFARIIAFFRALFKRLPVLEQK